MVLSNQKLTRDLEKASTTLTSCHAGAVLQISHLLLPDNQSQTQMCLPQQSICNGKLHSMSVYSPLYVLWYGIGTLRPVNMLHLCIENRESLFPSILPEQNFSVAI